DGTFGDPSCHCRTRPVTVAGLRGVIAVAAGQDHSLALLDDGTVFAWGRDDFGQLGDGTTGDPTCNCRLMPAPVIKVGGEFLDRAAAIKAGRFHSIALASTLVGPSRATVDGVVFEQGRNVNLPPGVGHGIASIT